MIMWWMLQLSLTFTAGIGSENLKIWCPYILRSNKEFPVSSILILLAWGPLYQLETQCTFNLLFSSWPCVLLLHLQALCVHLFILLISRSNVMIKRFKFYLYYTLLNSVLWCCKDLANRHLWLNYKLTLEINRSGWQVEIFVHQKNIFQFQRCK